MALSVLLRPANQQAAFNLKRWAEVQNDPALARLSHRIETDRLGRILMSPPPAPAHGQRQSEIAHLLRQLRPEGRVATECPLSTLDGVKAVDVAWLSEARADELESQSCLLTAPEVCVEVLSPANTKEEIEEKIALYFEAGAQEVWLCDLNGSMSYHVGQRENRQSRSPFCPEFPALIFPRSKRRSSADGPRRG
jgi:Uma2 family endonuclease